MSNPSRLPVHDAAVGFRVNVVLLSAVEARAAHHGMTISELIRHVLRRELRQPTMTAN